MQGENLCLPPHMRGEGILVNNEVVKAIPIRVASTPQRYENNTNAVI